MEAAEAGVADAASLVAGLPNENPPDAAGLSAGFSAAESDARLGAPKLKPPAAGAGAIYVKGISQIADHQRKKKSQQRTCCSRASGRSWGT